MQEAEPAECSSLVSTRTAWVSVSAVGSLRVLLKYCGFVVELSLMAGRQATTSVTVGVWVFGIVGQGPASYRP